MAQACLINFKGPLFSLIASDKGWGLLGTNKKERKRKICGCYQSATELKGLWLVSVG